MRNYHDPNFTGRNWGAEVQVPKHASVSDLNLGFPSSKAHTINHYAVLLFCCIFVQSLAPLTKHLNRLSDWRTLFFLVFEEPAQA